MNKVTTIFIVIVVIILLCISSSILFGYFWGKSQHYEHMTQSNESVQNLSSVFNPINFAVTDLDVTGEIYNLSEVKFNVIPRGLILIYNGEIAPAGWAICDGTNGTPNLTGRSVLGADPAGTKGAPRKVNDIGGSTTHTLTINELPSHTHSYELTRGTTRVNAANTFLNHIFITGFEELNATTSKTGGNAPHNNMPPYIALNYIMKL